MGKAWLQSVGNHPPGSETEGSGGTGGRQTVLLRPHHGHRIQKTVKTKKKKNNNDTLCFSCLYVNNIALPMAYYFLEEREQCPLLSKERKR